MHPLNVTVIDVEPYETLGVTPEHVVISVVANDPDILEPVIIV